MNYVTQGSMTLNYTIPAKKFANSVLERYHVDVLQGSSGQRINFPATTITPAEQGGADGLVAFDVALTEPGIYVMTVCYATAVDLDGFGTSFVPVGNATVQYVVPVTEVTA